MPIYEYRCKDCGHYLDVLQKVSDDPLTKCPGCGEPEGLKRLISAPAFRLKGGGWYETDFKTDKEKRRNLAESGGASSGSEGGTSSGAEGGSSSSGEGSGASKSSEGAAKSGDGGAKSGDGAAKSSGGSQSSSAGSQSKAAV